MMPAISESHLLLLAVLLGVPLAGCAKPAPSGPPLEVGAGPAVLLDSAELDGAVGTVVTLVGIQSQTKWPTVLGADVDGDAAMAGQRVRVTGRVERHIEEDPLREDGTIAQGRAAGTTSYRIVDPATGQLARPRLD